jgi:integrase
MASIRRRKSGYQVQIRRSHQTLCKTFPNRQDAIRWARHQESQIDLGAAARTNSPALIEVIERYGRDIAPRQRREENCVGILAKLMRERWVAEPVHLLQAARLSAYRDKRMAICAGETVRRELGLLQTILRYARREWAIPINDALLQVAKPAADPHRTRRLTPKEATAIASAFEPRFYELVQVALETALRRGELLRVEVSHIDRARALLSVPETKNGHPRIIPLTLTALEILDRWAPQRGGRVFQFSPRAVQMRWYRAMRRLEIEDLHFHDLRHEAISRFFEAGLTIPEVALISGHRDPRMLFRYTHLRAEDVGQKLRQLRLISPDLIEKRLLENHA